MRRISWIVAVWALAGCSMLERHNDSGYSSHSQSSKSGWTKVDKTPQDKMSAKNDLQLSLKTRIRHLENGLSSRKEIEQYSKSLPWFKSDEERAEFLELGGFEARQRWIAEQSFMNRPSNVTKDLQELVEAQDIAVGMPEPLVKKSWGEPETIEVSGNPQFKNQKWRYQKFVSSSDGYKKENKVVYFEGGKVVGWEVE